MWYYTQKTERQSDVRDVLMTFRNKQQEILEKKTRYSGTTDVLG